MSMRPAGASAPIAGCGSLPIRQITVYTIAARRGHEVIIDILGGNSGGCWCRCFKAYDAAALAEWLQQKCVGTCGATAGAGRARKRAGRSGLRGRDGGAARRVGPEGDAPPISAARPTKQPRRSWRRAWNQWIDGRGSFRDPDNARMAARLRFQREHLFAASWYWRKWTDEHLAERQLPAERGDAQDGGLQPDGGGRGRPRDLGQYPGHMSATSRGDLGLFDQVAAIRGYPTLAGAGRRGARHRRYPRVFGRHACTTFQLNVNTRNEVFRCPFDLIQMDVPRFFT